jgi:hypothetical protein
MRAVLFVLDAKLALIRVEGGDSCKLLRIKRKLVAGAGSNRQPCARAALLVNFSINERLGRRTVASCERTGTSLLCAFR